MIGYVYIFIVLMILLGFDIAFWGTCLLLLGFSSVLIANVIGVNELANAGDIIDTTVGVMILGFFIYFVTMLFLFPFFRYLALHASRRFRVFQALAPDQSRVPRVPPSEVNQWLRWAYVREKYLDHE